MDFGALPPEINSARIYAGPGSGPMLSAAVAWGGLAAELRSTAAAYQSVVSGLTTGPWRGPASASMAAAAAPYVAWTNTTAAQAEQTADQAMAAAGAYEQAFAMTVPPPVIAANRAQLAMLVATNILGQNTPAIMATEAHYAEMWAQDAAAMYGYAASSAAASKVTPFTPPAQTTNPAALPGQAGAVAQATGTSAGTGTQTTLAQAMSAVPTRLQSLAAPASATSSSSGLTGIPNTLSGTGTAGSVLEPNSTFWNTVMSTGAFNPGQYVDAVLPAFLIPWTSSGSSGLSPAFSGLAPPVLTAGLGSGAGGLPGFSGLGGAGSAVSAGMGQAASVGPLSVPPSWAAAAPPVTSVAPANTGLGAIPQNGAPGVPGVPIGSMAGHGVTNAAPRYGFRPTVMARPPAAG
jgi:PPE-repeat protein